MGPRAGHHSIRNNFLEETYEAIDAIDAEDLTALREELGDVLLQVVFHAQIEAEKGGFTLDDVADGICKKLILRHPHIFGDTVAKTSEEVLRNWDAIKQVEKGQATKTDTLVSVPKVFPGLMRAQKVQSRAAKAGFDYDGLEGAFTEMEDEVAELWQAIESKKQADIEDELGRSAFCSRQRCTVCKNRCGGSDRACDGQVHRLVSLGRGNRYRTRIGSENVVA